jgi:hypothetical protein
VTASGSGRVGRAGGYPSVRGGIVSPASVKCAAGTRSTPGDHFTVRPDCRVTASGVRGVGGAGGCPAIRAGIVSPAGGVAGAPQMIISVPVHTAVCPIRASGALVMLVAVHVSVVGLYLPPVLNRVG